LTSPAGKKTFVLDTSVLLADPSALTRFAEHEVIIPIVVIGELETKRDHPELGFFARAALRALDARHSWSP
jgi:PhoH-like ATPase